LFFIGEGVLGNMPLLFSGMKPILALSSFGKVFSCDSFNPTSTLIGGTHSRTEVNPASHSFQILVLAHLIRIPQARLVTMLPEIPPVA
jgi:hypothetical protein